MTQHWSNYLNIFLSVQIHDSGIYLSNHSTILETVLWSLWPQEQISCQQEMSLKASTRRRAGHPKDHDKWLKIMKYNIFSFYLFAALKTTSKSFLLPNHNALQSRTSPVLMIYNLDVSGISCINDTIQNKWKARACHSFFVAPSSSGSSWLMWYRYHLISPPYFQQYSSSWIAKTITKSTIVCRSFDITWYHIKESKIVSFPYKVEVVKNLFEFLIEYSDN